MLCCADFVDLAGGAARLHAVQVVRSSGACGTYPAQSVRGGSGRDCQEFRQTKREERARGPEYRLVLVSIERHRQRHFAADHRPVQGKKDDKSRLGKGLQSVQTNKERRVRESAREAWRLRWRVVCA